MLALLCTMASHACMLMQCCLPWCVNNCIGKGFVVLVLAVHLLLSQGCFVTSACFVLHTLCAATSVTFQHGVGLVRSWVSKQTPWHKVVSMRFEYTTRTTAGPASAANPVSMALGASLHTAFGKGQQLCTQAHGVTHGLHTDVHSEAAVSLLPLLCAPIAAALVSVEPLPDRA